MSERLAPALEGYSPSRAFGVPRLLAAGPTGGATLLTLGDTGLDPSDGGCRTASRVGVRSAHPGNEPSPTGLTDDR